MVTVNRVTLIGKVLHSPRYFCTPQAQDLARFTLSTVDDHGVATNHECVAWGAPALHLHAHLRPGDLLLIRGTLRHRPRPRRKGAYVRLQQYAFLGNRYGGATTPGHSVAYPAFG
ncbi:single-stranded DNA-binding protein [Neolewinella xylanilytica]|uniref:single-stranded DNA-binding protein n=1 Tax=Neolewinella xylanilytica TaxID=1514080 RepID=UPI000CEB094C